MDHRDLLNVLLAKQEMDAVQCKFAVSALLGQQWDPSVIGAFLALLQAKGASGSELASMAAGLRSCAVPVSIESQHLVDTCGTGGGPATFNISTAAAIVASACGATVAKHGNRAVTSQCGSADVLEALGVTLSQTPEHAEQLLNGVGIAFLFAPAFHPALASVGPIRRALGVRTVFNQLGPLLNPASAPSQIVGVYGPHLLAPTAEALRALGSQRAWVVCSQDGLDEISPSATTLGIEVRSGEVTPFEMNPSDWGNASIDLHAIAAGPTVDDNANALREALDRPESPFGKAIVPNAGAAIYLSGLAASHAEGCDRARSAMESGAASNRLSAWVEASTAP